MTTVERARVIAREAGVLASVVEGEPVNIDYPCPSGVAVVVWGCTWSQACAMERDGQDWFEQYPEVQLAPDVFTWEGMPRWSVWVDNPCAP